VKALMTLSEIQFFATSPDQQTMEITRYRNTFIAAGIAALLGFGVSACGKTPDDAARQEASGSAGTAEH
jgi:hypothetical protein